VLIHIKDRAGKLNAIRRQKELQLEQLKHANRIRQQFPDTPIDPSVFDDIPCLDDNAQKICRLFFYPGGVPLPQLNPQSAFDPPDLPANPTFSRPPEPPAVPTPVPNPASHFTIDPFQASRPEHPHGTPTADEYQPQPQAYNEDAYRTERQMSVQPPRFGNPHNQFSGLLAARRHTIASASPLSVPAVQEESKIETPVPGYTSTLMITDALNPTAGQQSYQLSYSAFGAQSSWTPNMSVGTELAYPCYTSIGPDFNGVINTNLNVSVNDHTTTQYNTHSAPYSAYQFP